MRWTSVLSFLVVGVLVMFAAGASWIAPFSPEETFFDGLTLEGAPTPPSTKYWFGTDLLGRDLFSREIWSAQTSLVVGVVANGAAVLIGSVVGITAGYLRGWVGDLLMRFTDLMISNAGLALQRGQTPQTYEVSSPSSHRKAISISQIAQPTRTTSLASNVVIPEYLWGFSEAAGA